MKYRNKAIAASAVVLVLIFAYMCGGKAPEPNEQIGEQICDSEFAEIEEQDAKETAQPTDFKEAVTDKQAEEKKPEELPYNKPAKTKDADDNKAVKLPQQDNASSEKNDDITKKENICTLSVRCDTALKYPDRTVSETIRENGVIFEEQEVVFYEGESVFNLLLREMKKNKIHMEFVSTPIYNSAYIEGIANLYEFDCGELSGWMYKVNGAFPSCGCSRYTLAPGDKVEWVYTCDLGKDVGSSNGRMQRDD